MTKSLKSREVILCKYTQYYDLPQYPMNFDGLSTSNLIIPL